MRMFEHTIIDLVGLIFRRLWLISLCVCSCQTVSGTGAMAGHLTTSLKQTWVEMSLFSSWTHSCESMKVTVFYLENWMVTMLWWYNSKWNLYLKTLSWSSMAAQACSLVPWRLRQEHCSSWRLVHIIRWDTITKMTMTTTKVNDREI